MEAGGVPGSGRGTSAGPSVASRRGRTPREPTRRLGRDERNPRGLTIHEIVECSVHGRVPSIGNEERNRRRPCSLRDTMCPHPEKDAFPEPHGSH